jgi:hypothetical protein
MDICVAAPETRATYGVLSAKRSSYCSFSVMSISGDDQYDQKMKISTAAPKGIFLALPFERQTQSATSITAQKSKIAQP